MINFKDLNLATEIKTTTIKIDDTTNLEVRDYLPMNEKIELISNVVDYALDENTGRFSPVRTALYFDLALVHHYAGINFDGEDMIAAYDVLETTGLLDKIVSAIPQDEYNFMKDLVDETTHDIADYNSSFAGVMQIASSDANGLSAQIEDILGKVKNREGLELLGEIKNVAGKD